MSSTSTGATAGASTSTGGASTPVADPERERAAEACTTAISVVDDYREGFCALTALFGQTGAAPGPQPVADAGTAPEPADCEACASGEDTSQQEMVLGTCTDAVTDCAGLTKAEVDTCLDAARPVFDNGLPTCADVGSPQASTAAALLFLQLYAAPECTAFLSCGDLLDSLVMQ